MPDEHTGTFPAGASIHTSLRLVTWHPRGLLDAALADEILRFMEAEKAHATGPFNRFADLTGLEGVHLNFTEVEEIAARRVKSYHGAPAKSAILALNPLTFGIARMYEQLMLRSPIEVGVFSKLNKAADWLGIPIEVLEGA